MKTLACALLLIPGFVVGQNVDQKVLQEALAETQAILNDPEQRGQVIQKDPRAQSADQQLQSLTQNPQLTSQTYAIAAEILASMISKFQGDTDAMQKYLDQANRDPSSFLNSLPQGIQAKIRDIASKVQANKAQH